MPQSLSLVIIHLVFSTKDRTPNLTKQITTDLYPYLANIVRNIGCECYRIGGAPDHVHLAIRLSRTTSIAKLVELTKTNSSKWLKTQSVKDFAWQNGYGCFSVAPADLNPLLRYLDTQEEHHKKYDFKEEFLALLGKYGIEYDERHIWD